MASPTKVFEDWRCDFVYEWNLTAADPTGDELPQKIVRHSDRSVQVSGTFDGATVIIEGRSRVSSAIYYTLRDPFGNLLSFTTAGGAQCLEIAYGIRARMTGAGGSAAINVAMMMRN